MSVPIDPANPAVIHRQIAPYSASLGGEGERPAHGQPLDGTRRVEPVEKAGKGRATDDGRLREGRHDRERVRFSHDGEVEAQPEVVASSYDRRLSYEADVNRVYLDIVNEKDDEILMRIPSENTAKYLEQITARSDEKDAAKPAPRVLHIA